MPRKIDSKYIQPKHIAEIVAKAEGVKKEVALFVVNEFFKFIKERLIEHKNVHIYGLGWFWINHHKILKKRNIKYNTYYWWKDRPSVKFLVSKTIKLEIKRRSIDKD